MVSKVIFALSLMGLHVGVFAAERVALVIGNSQYQALNRLPNPKNDANAIASKLTALGFKLMNARGGLGSRAVLNVKEDNFLTLIEQFSQQAKSADIAMLYYAGHGMQFGAESYLLPVDVGSNNIKLIERHAIGLESVLKALDGKAKLTVAVFDACREIPELEQAIGEATRGSGLTKADYRGLTRVKSKGRSRIVAFSGAAGQLVADGTGRNSPYTTELLKHLGKSGLTVNEVFDTVSYEFGLKHQGQHPEVLSSGVKQRTYYFVKEYQKPKVNPDTHYELAVEQQAVVSKPPPVVKAPVPEIPRYPFTINTTPAHARVRVLNIKPKYRAGMLLAAGTYKIEVTAAGYAKVVGNAEFTAKSRAFSVDLKRLEQAKKVYQAPKVAYEAPKKAKSRLIAGRYRDLGDGTVKDTQTGLQWMRCELGKTWQNNDCIFCCSICPTLIYSNLIRSN